MTQRDKLEKLPQDAAILETETKYHMSDVESDTEEALLHRTLPWRDDDLNDLIHRCDRLISLIRKYVPVSARSEPLRHS